MEKINPMKMQAAEPEYMCTECGFKFYAHQSNRPDQCPYCKATFKWNGYSAEKLKTHVSPQLADKTPVDFWEHKNETPKECQGCAKHPLNGGNGICHYVLGR